MENNIPRLPLSLNRVYIVSLCIIALLATVRQLYIHTLLREANQDEEIVNVISQQQIKCQEIIRTTLLLQASPDVRNKQVLAQQLKSLINTWDQVHFELRPGAIPTDGQAVVFTPTNQALYTRASQAFRIIKQQSNKVVRLVASPSQSLAGPVTLILQQEPVYLQTMRALANQHKKTSHQKVASLKKWELILYLITLGVLLLESILIFRPTVRKINFYFQELVRTSELTAELNMQLEEKTAEQQQAQEKLQDIFIQQRALIAQHKRTEKELLEKQRFITAITQATPDVLYVYDLKEGKNLFTNRKIAKVLGFGAEEVMDMDKSLLIELVHPDDLPNLRAQKQNIRQALEGEMQMLEYRMKHKEGHYVWLLCQEVVFAKENGITTQVLGIAQDITEKKKNLAALEESEAKYRSMIEKAEDLIYENGYDGYFTYVNPVVERQLGYSREELQTVPYWNLVKAAYRDEVVAFYRKQFETRTLNSYFELPVISKTGKEIWLGQNATFEYENGLLKTVRVIARDITRLRRAEQKIKESEYRYRTVVNNIAEVVFQTDAEGKWSFLNPAWTRVTGFSVAESLGKLYLESIHPEDRAKSIELFKPLIRQEKEYVRYEIRYLVKDGNYKWLEVFAQLALDEKRRVVGITGTIMDISERKAVEETLIRAKEQAEEAAAAKQSFLSMMSHEIRTPMNAVIGMTHLLLQENPRPDQWENLNILKFSADNLLVLINDILDYSKIEAGKISFEEVDFELSKLISSVEQSMLYRAQEKNIFLEVVMDAAIPTMLMGDPVRLGQVLNNLVSNAIKFTERGMVRIEATAEEVTEEKAKIKIAVSDTGIGIPEDKLEFIFERFTQAGSDTTRKFGGTGLGLAITKRLLEMQNSQIYVESVLDLGSRFYFTMEFKRGGCGNIHHLPEFKETKMADLGSLRILLVEDNEANTIVATKFLNQWGIQPDYATNGQMAVEMIQQNRYDLLLMDLQMPVMDGYTATRYIRTLDGAYFQQLPIIALTASAMSDVKQKLLEIGMNDYVTKPFNPSELYNKISYYSKASSGNLADTNLSLKKGSNNTVLTAIDEIAGNDDAFKQKLISVYIQTLQECKAVYLRALSGGDEPMLRALGHKMYPTLTILSAHSLLEEIETGKRLLNKTSNTKEIKNSVEQMGFLCDQIIEELNNLPYYSNSFSNR